MSWLRFPVFCFFGFLDRLYQFYRFGSFTNTYVSVVAKETIARRPDLPHNYPWTTPFHEGFLGALFAPEKSIFLFDPLLILASCSSCSTGAEFRLTFARMQSRPALMLLAYLSFYARYFAWAGDFAWGDRYVSTAVELLALIGDSRCCCAIVANQAGSSGPSESFCSASAP